MQDIRWKQRFDNYTRSLALLNADAALHKTRHLSELEAQGLIQAFEMTYELAWNVLKDYLTHQGISDITGSRDAFRKAFQLGLVREGALWLEMMSARQRTAHTYSADAANEVTEKILAAYVPAFVELQQTFAARLHEE